MHTKKVMKSKANSFRFEYVLWNKLTSPKPVQADLLADIILQLVKLINNGISQLFIQLSVKEILKCSHRKNKGFILYYKYKCVWLYSS